MVLISAVAYLSMKTTKFCTMWKISRYTVSKCNVTLKFMLSPFTSWFSLMLRFSTLSFSHIPTQGLVDSTEWMIACSNRGNSVQLRIRPAASRVWGLPQLSHWGRMWVTLEIDIIPCTSLITWSETRQSLLYIKCPLAYLSKILYSRNVLWELGFFTVNFKIFAWQYHRTLYKSEHLLIANCKFFLGSQLIDPQT